MDRNKLMLATAAVVCTVMAAAIAVRHRAAGRRRRRMWTRPWLERRNRGRGLLTMVENELLPEDPVAYRNFIRMTEEQFLVILSLTRKDYERSDTNMRGAISAEQRLALTLRFLATGESFRSMMYSSRIHESTISLIIPEVCRSIYNNLKTEYLQVPRNSEEWERIAREFQSLWGFPMCLGAIDGKHIAFRPPASAGSFYFNYKGGHSIVLLALVDAKYKFIYVDVGVNGRVSDGGVFRESTLAAAIYEERLNFPASRPLPGKVNPVPYVFVADDAFPLTTRILKPYPFRDLTPDKRNYNFRLSRARRVVENAFGILTNRFRVFLTVMNLAPEKVECITLAAVALHNFLCMHNSHAYTNIDDTNEVNMLPGLPMQGANRPTNSAMNIRSEYCAYFNSL